MLTFIIILGFIMLIAAAFNAAKQKYNRAPAYIVIVILTMAFLFFLLSL